MCCRLPGRLGAYWWTLHMSMRISPWSPASAQHALPPRHVFLMFWTPSRRIRIAVRDARLRARVGSRLVVCAPLWLIVCGSDDGSTPHDPLAVVDGARPAHEWPDAARQSHSPRRPRSVRRRDEGRVRDCCRRIFGSAAHPAVSRFGPSAARRSGPTSEGSARRPRTGRPSDAAATR